MQMNIFFSDSETQVEDFEFYLALLKKVLNGYHRISPFLKLSVDVYKGDSDETQKEKACDKGIRQQRRNKAVKNVSKSS